MGWDGIMGVSRVAFSLDLLIGILLDKVKYIKSYPN
jgi:hypothetical protein